MKKVFCYLLLTLFILDVYAQEVPSGFGYQAVIRDAAGVPKKGEKVSLKFTLLPGESSNSPAWIETHDIQTDSQGICNLVIGEGFKIGGTAQDFADIDFGAFGYWIEVELKEEGKWISITKQRLLSVPYARFASQVAYAMPPVPIGTILPFAGKRDKIPKGWLLCDGKQILISEYKNLFDVIGTSWGRGDNTNATFHLPDLRGLFLRGVDKASDDNVSNRDPDRDTRSPLNEGGNVGNEVGSYQGDEFKSHDHKIKEFRVGWNTEGNGYNRKIDSDDGQGWGNYNQEMESDLKGGNETRPKNAYVYYIIKY